jgi:hypothetical protein
MFILKWWFKKLEQQSLVKKWWFKKLEQQSLERKFRIIFVKFWVINLGLTANWWKLIVN